MKIDLYCEFHQRIDELNNIGNHMVSSKLSQCHTSLAN
jgi:hypothetical protein